MSKTVLITGSSQGIGLEFCKQLSALDYNVIASCRRSSRASALKELGKKIKMRELDITAENQLINLRDELIRKPIDILILNAAVFGQREMGIGNIDVDDMIETFKTNAIYQLKVIEAFLPHLLAGHDKKIIAISTTMASITDNTTGSDYSYRGSKAALNAMIYSAALDLNQYGIRTLLLHPGWVCTSMGGDLAPLNVKDSVSAMIKVIESDFKSGSFLDYKGHTLPW